MAQRPHIARIVVNLSLDRVFDYAIPEHLQERVSIGTRVRVPFGHGAQEGYVVELPEFSPHGDALKPIEQVIGDRAMIPEKLLDLAEWMAGYYCCAREQAVKALLPAVVRGKKGGHKTHKTVRLAPDIDLAEVMAECETRAKRQAELLKYLEREGTVSLSLLSAMSAGATKGLRDKGWVVVEDAVEMRDPFAGMELLPTVPLTLNEEQAAAMEMVNASLASPDPKPILLLGVTGSGKTEVYLQAIATALETGRESIVLVPEISLTPQTMERFRGRFGEQVSVLHSHLSDGERFDEWTRINDGSVKIVVGARSAVFAPFRNLGLIVVDEEHETSYKQGDLDPRYHARDVAVVRGKLEGAVVLLGSATPAIESYYNATVTGKYQIARMTRRVDDQCLPTMEVVDMAAESMATGGPKIISRRLRAVVNAALEKNEQVLLFLNRRGYATNLTCYKCGFTAECDDCSVKYTYHKSRVQIICHMCGAVRHAPKTCPKCQDPEIRYGGIGTERVEAHVRGMFKHAKVLRMDSDTMTRKEAYREALGAFRAGEVDILIGTQMIAKGLHFPNVTIVGIINADTSLNLPDFRADERTFHLLVQVAGRAGRGEVAGHVIVQSYSPYHEAISAAMEQDVEGYYDYEIDHRTQLMFPPVSRLVLIRTRGPTETAVEATARQVHERLKQHLPEGTTLIPPTPSPILKKRGLFHYQMLLYTTRVGSLSRAIKHVLHEYSPPKDVRIIVDVDTYNMS